MTDAKNINKPLFSQHYLDYRLQESPEWQLDIKLDFEKLKICIYQKKRFYRLSMKRKLKMYLLNPY